MSAYRGVAVNEWYPQNPPEVAEEPFDAARASLCTVGACEARLHTLRQEEHVQVREIVRQAVRRREGARLAFQLGVGYALGVRGVRSRSTRSVPGSGVQPFAGKALVSVKGVPAWIK